MSSQQHHLERAGLPWGPAFALFKRLETAEAWRQTTTNLLIRRSTTLHQVWNTLMKTSKKAGKKSLQKQILILLYKSYLSMETGKALKDECILSGSSKKSSIVYWLPSPPLLFAAPRGSHGFLRSLKDSLDRASAVKRVQRSQSASPCRIPNPAKVHLSVHGRVYASPDRSTAVAWTRGFAAPRRWKMTWSLVIFHSINLMASSEHVKHLRMVARLSQYFRVCVSVPSTLGIGSKEQQTYVFF